MGRDEADDALLHLFEIAIRLRSAEDDAGQPNGMERHGGRGRDERAVRGHGQRIRTAPGPDRRDARRYQKRLLDDIQKVTDEAIKEVDQIIAEKDKELMSL